MRRKTNNRDLARRAKDLVRKWHSLYLPSASQSATAATVNVHTTGEASSAASALRESAEVVKQKQTAATNGVRLPVNKSENGLHTKTTSPVECATSVRSNLAPGRSRLPIDLQPRSGSKPCTPVTSGLHPSQSVPSFAVAGSSSRTPKTSLNSKSPSTVQPIKSDKISISVEKTKNGKSLPRPSSANGIDVTGYVCNDKHVESVSILNSFDADTDSKHWTIGNIGVRNGSLKSLATQSPSNGIWSPHCGIELSNRNNSLSKVQSPLTPDSAANETVQPRTVLKIKINRTSGSGSVSSPVGERQTVTVPASSVRKMSKETVSHASVSKLVSSPVVDTSSVVTPVRNVQKKVVTTAQLIKQMHANGELHLVNSETLSRIANNQIKHEADEAPQSVVPDGAKPRPHKRRRVDAGTVVHTLNEPPCMTDADLLRVKEERVRNFLQMSADAELPTSMDNDLISLLPQLPQPSRFSEHENGSEFEKPKPIDSVNYEQESINVDIPYKLPELPAIDLSSIDWYSNDYTVEEFRPSPTYADLERLHYGHWEGVNGQRDHRGEWADWTQVYSVRSYNNDVLHILPYVDITD